MMRLAIVAVAVLAFACTAFESNKTLEIDNLYVGNGGWKPAPGDPEPEEGENPATAEDEIEGVLPDGTFVNVDGYPSRGATFLIFTQNDGTEQKGSKQDVDAKAAAAVNSPNAETVVEEVAKEEPIAEEPVAEEDTP